MTTFYCELCEKKFKAKGKKQMFHSPVFGSCWNLVASCPTCKVEMKEYKVVSNTKKNSGSFSSDMPATAPSCATGACPYVN